VGCASAGEVQALAQVGMQFQPLVAEEETKLLELFRPQARRRAYYRGAI
jgi:hypothetical protein